MEVLFTLGSMSFDLHELQAERDMPKELQSILTGVYLGFCKGGHLVHLGLRSRGAKRHHKRPSAVLGDSAIGWGRSSLHGSPGYNLGESFEIYVQILHSEALWDDKYMVRNTYLLLLNFASVINYVGPSLPD